MPKPFSSQSKKLISSLITYFERERDNGGPLLPLSSVRERVAEALSICIASVSSISKTRKQNDGQQSPKKTRPRRKPICDVTPTIKATIRDTIYDMYKNKQHFTRASLLSLLKERHIFDGSVDSLGRVLADIGFKYKKDCPRKGLMEQTHVALARTNFLRKYMNNLDSESPMECVYLDETWIFENGTVARSWQDDSHKSVRKLKVDGKRFIVVHAGTCNGFIDGASLVFSSNTSNPDYHGEMDKNNFLNWFKNELICKLEEPSMIVMDNASYHSVLYDKCPNNSWNKDQIRVWLNNHNIPAADDLLKVELLDLVKCNKPEKKYVADILAEKHGHTVVCLPPYHGMVHCIFNPIEHIWGISKTYYNKHIGEQVYGEKNAVKMWNKALEMITPEIWANTVRHRNSEIRKWWDRELLLDREEVTPFIINVNQCSDSEDSRNSDSE